MRIVVYDDDLLKPGDAARILNVSYKTLWRWQKRGLIRVVRLPSGRFLIPRSEVERILRQGSEA